MRRQIFLLLTALIIFSSCKLKDDTTPGIVDPITNNVAITVVAPNGGELLSEGSSYQIQWNGTGTTHVKIQYSFDNGSSWGLVVDSLKNTGLYSWFPVPNTISNQCRIRVSSVDGINSDDSDKSFAIIKNSNESLRLVSPVGKESWEAGSAKQIKWYSSGLDSVKIQYTTDNGRVWNLIAVDKKNTGVYYWEPVPNTPSTLAKVRISDAKDGYPSVESPDVFEILPEPKLRVIAPNGGEKILAGTSRKIEYVSENVEKVKIAYSTNNGFNWTTITESTSATGFYVWEPVPNLNSQLCKVRIYDAKDGEPSDVSDSVFTITNQVTQTIEITSPNGSEKWQAGTAQNITWTSGGIPKVKLEFTSNNGLTWNTLVDNFANTGAYEWNVPNSLSTQCLIKISDASDGDPTDQSNATFNIVPKPELKVLKPNGGEIWTGGLADTVRWYSVGVENVSIEYTTNNGGEWKSVVSKTPSSGSYITSFSIPGSSYKIRIKEADTGSPQDESDGTFTVTPEPSITVTAPNGNEEWYVGSSDNIRWTSAYIEFVKIEYSINNGATWNLIVANTPSTGSYSWSPVPNVSSLQCRVRISDALIGIPSDISDNNFTITNRGNQLIKVTSPNGGEKWPAGTSQEIKWDAAGVSNVKIEYTINNGDSWNTITTSTPSTGYYTWIQVPNTPATNCKVRISDASDGSPSDDSDQFFSIGTAPSIKVLTPNGNDTWLSGSSKEILWSSENVENVKIEYTINGGATWTIITNSIQSTGSYLWANIPNVNSLQCKIKISDAVYGTPSDISDDNFAIMSPGAQQIKVTSPNGGELWPLGSSQNITWDAGGIANVKIEYTINNGISWNLITANTPSTGYYTWAQIPNIPATNCKVRISDALDGLPSDESDQFFSIGAAPSLKVLTPNGNDTWISGSSKDIKWSSENVENVKIEYTTNGGGTWTTITSSAPSIGTYTWNNIPDANNSLQCKIKISDAVYGTPSDISDDNFAIMNAGAQQIKVTSPNGGEKWSLGSSQNITWDAGGIANVKIEYTINNGNSWNTLIASTPSNGFYTWSQIPNTLSTNCKVRISDAQDGSPLDESDQFFSIVPAPDIKVVSPNGSETIQSGTNYEIRYTSENVENVKIEYTLNGGAVWSTIINTTPSIGTYLWTNVPNTNSLQCKIRVSDAHNGTPFDISDQNFQITNLVVQSVKVISPNGGEDWEAGTQQNITWNSSGISKVKIELSSNKGANWDVLVDNFTGGAYQWTIGETLNSSQCQIRISDAINNTISDISDGVFIISPRKFINVISPRGPVTYKDSDPIEILWESGGIKTVGIKYTWTDGVAQLPDIPAYTVLVSQMANQGHYTTSFAIPSDKYHVIVYNADEGGNNTPSARNIGSFTIVKTEIPKITVLTPNGGEQWLVTAPNTPNTDVQKYHPFEIRWTATKMEKVKIEWSTTGGGTWHPVYGADSTTNDGIFVWAPGNMDPIMPDSSDNCLIRISKPNGTESQSDMSDNFFSMHKSKKIRVVFPNNGEDFYRPEAIPPKSDIHWPMAITWTSYAISGNVDIYYSLQNGAENTWFPIVQGYPSTGLYAWDFTWGTLYGFLGPIENSWSSLGRIKIVDSADGKVWDVSDNPFWLNAKKVSGAIIPGNNSIKLQEKR